MNVATVYLRLREWADAHPECDTQGITVDEWLDLARAACGEDS